MKVYRIARPEFVEDLSGYGASMHGGRWNSKYTSLLYTSETASLAILELLAYLEDAPIPYQLIELNISKGDIMSIYDLGLNLPHNWANDRTGKQLTQKIGNDWVNNSTSAILKVPSIHNPFEHNYLINPVHKSLKIEISQKSWYLYDYRLVEKSND